MSPVASISSVQSMPVTPTSQPTSSESRIARSLMSPIATVSTSHSSASAQIHADVPVFPQHPAYQPLDAYNMAANLLKALFNKETRKQCRGRSRGGS